LSLCATRRRIRGVEIKISSFLTSTVGAGEWSVSCPGHYNIGKEPRYPLKRRMGRPQSQSWRFIEVKNIFPPPVFEPRVNHIAK